MTRIGINPARGKQTDYRPAPVTVTMVTYIPSLSGYFEQRLEVLKLSLASLIAHTRPAHDLMIFDNGSCEVVLNYLIELQRAGYVNYLLLSERNIGKIDALHILFNAAPGEIIAYNDDDILLYPGWLEAHLDALERFPQAGMVSGVPIRNASGHALQSLERLVSQGVEGMQFTRERRIPDAWEEDWALSTGRDPERHLQDMQGKLDLVLRAERPDGSGICEMIAGANHFQFVSPKQVILQALPKDWTGKLMGAMIELDEAVDRLGYLRLSTTQRYARHLGNSLSQEARQEAASLGLPTNAIPKPGARRGRKRHPLLRIPGSRRIFSAIYNRLFDLLYR